MAVQGMAGLAWVDWALLALLGLSVLVGVWRGLVFELMSLVGWVVAFVAAQAAAPWLAAQLPVANPGSAARQGLAFALAFIAALVLWTLLARLVRLIIHATPLTLIDRLLGAGFGLMRGGVLLLVLATLVAFTPAARSQAWHDSRGATWLGAVLAGIKPMLPAGVVRHLPT